MSKHCGKKIITKDYAQHNGFKESLAKILSFDNRIRILPEAGDGTFALEIPTLEGYKIADAHDWVLQDEHGNLEVRRKYSIVEIEGSLYQS